MSRLLEWLPTAIAAAAGVLWVKLAGWIAPENLEWKLPAKIVLQGAGLLFLILAYLGILYLRLWLRSRTREAFGVLWNRRGNPVCSRCSAPLTKLSASAFSCPACQIQYPLYDLTTGGPVDVWDAYRTMARSKKQQPSPKEPERIYPDLGEIKTQILVLLSTERGLRAREIAAKIQISEDVAQFHLDEMFRGQFVEWGTEKTYRDTVWRLAHDGVGYLVERGLHT